MSCSPSSSRSRRTAKPAVVLALAACLVLAAAAWAKGPVQVLVLEKGQVFKVTLPANHTTGFRWVMVSLPPAKVVKLLDTKYLPIDNRNEQGKQRLGSGGHEVWTFQAMGKGTAFISLHYVQPWVKDKPPAKSRELEIQVR